MKRVLLSIIFTCIFIPFLYSQLNNLKGKVKDKAIQKTSQPNTLTNPKETVKSEPLTTSVGNCAKIDDNVDLLSDATSTLANIKFSKKPIVPGNDSKNEFSDEFTINDNIYGMIYLKDKIKNLGQTKNCSHFVQVDKGQTYYFNVNFTIDDADMEKDYYPIEIIPSPDNAMHTIDAVEFARYLPAIPVGKREIEIIFNIGYTEIAQGKFKLDLTGIDKEKLKANAESAAKKASDNWAKNVALPDIFNNPSQKFKDPELSQAAMKQICKTGISGCIEIIRIVVLGDGTADDYHLFKNNLGVPLYKQTKPGVAIIYKKNDGCYFQENIEFKRDYTGGGNYSKPKLIEGNPVKFDCSKVK